ncbi:hypothetical protein [Kurthia sibirica]|uniref:Uncharacterized protein n=1 Tax=Kurthia sibirica TaxID=202750 RepID=A0A2U3AIY6_9BACL|nr:hypothetical protein [Kurthia sibirica]PWI24505.1 hypothetical protein DEX24_13005 [Kurthia sibirica]GEK33569.1 hypothetical protein KSI01_11020 [Kurthia sibirica]
MTIPLNYLACMPFSIMINDLEELLKILDVDSKELLMQHHIIHDGIEQIIVTAGDSKIDIQAIETSIQSTDFHYEKKLFSQASITQKPKTKIYFDRALRMRSEYALIDWQKHMIFYVLLDDIERAIHINYWISIGK